MKIPIICPACKGETLKVDEEYMQSTFGDYSNFPVENLNFYCTNKECEESGTLAEIEESVKYWETVKFLEFIKNEPYDVKIARHLASVWKVGFNDRGLGHGDFGVITEQGDLVIPDLDQQIAEHLVELHNKFNKMKESINNEIQDLKKMTIGFTEDESIRHEEKIAVLESILERLQ
jgi:hypothetical protein